MNELPFSFACGPHTFRQKVSSENESLRGGLLSFPRTGCAQARNYTITHAARADYVQPECMVRRFAASEKCVTGWSAQMYTAFVGVDHSWPGWNALRSLPH